MAKYQIQTENGTFEVETEESSSPAQEPEKGFLEKAADISNKIYPFTAPGMLQKGAELVSGGFNKAGELAAENLPKLGVSPEVSAGVGTALQMAPDAATAFTGAGAAKATKLGRAVTAPLMSTAKKNLGQAFKEAGVAVTDEIVSPKSGKGIQEFTQALKPLREASGKKIAEIMDPQQINQFRQQVGDILDYLNVAKSGANPKSLVPKATISHLAKTKDALVEALKVAKPELTEPLQQFAGAASRAGALKTAGKIIRRSAIPASLLGGLGYGLSR